MKVNGNLDVRRLRCNQRLWRSLRSFTLIEVLVVITIIVVLIALLYPALNQAEQRAIQIACMNKLRQMGMAWIICVNDYNGFFPPIKEYGYWEITVNASERYPQYIAPYLDVDFPVDNSVYQGDDFIFVCPAQRVIARRHVYLPRDTHVWLVPPEYCNDSYKFNAGQWTSPDKALVAGGKGKSLSQVLKMDPKYQWTLTCYFDRCVGCHVNENIHPPNRTTINRLYIDGSVRPFKVSDGTWVDWQVYP